MSKQVRKVERVDIAACLKVAEDEKDWGEVDEILYDACDNYPNALKAVLPHFFEHKFWPIRASAAEIVGIRRLVQFSDQVAARLRDRNADVRSYALMAYYELLGVKALPVIDEFCAAKNIEDRVTGLTLRYIQTGDPDAIEKLSRILRRKGCKSLHRFAALNIFDYYCDSKPDREVVKLFATILPDVPEDGGWAREMKSLVAKWKRSKARAGKQGQGGVAGSSVDGGHRRGHVFI